MPVSIEKYCMTILGFRRLFLNKFRLRVLRGSSLEGVSNKGPTMSLLKDQAQGLVLSRSLVLLLNETLGTTWPIDT